jgi:DNA-binding sugar fermentation-stimulating protein
MHRFVGPLRISCSNSRTIGQSFYSSSLWTATACIIMVVTRSGAIGSVTKQDLLVTALPTSGKRTYSRARKTATSSKTKELVPAKTTSVPHSDSTSPNERNRITTTSSIPFSGGRITTIKDDTQTVINGDILFSLPDDVVYGILRKRPSKRNKSPYVGDVWLESEQREAIVHLPNLDMGGKCVPGVTLVMKPAKDKKGNPVGKDAVNPKFGTPKCEFIAQLLRVDESDLSNMYEPTWVGAHPSLGEKIAEELVSRNLLGPTFPTVQSYKREVSNVGGTDMRCDFLIEHVDTTLPPRILEVKTVVDTDYSTSAVPNREKCVFTSNREPYIRTGIFPWGSSNQKGPQGEPVVSARAIKHVRELTRMVQERPQRFDATVLFIVIRHDAKAFRPNTEACPSFARYLKEAKEKGVQVLAKQVRWGEEKPKGDEVGTSLIGKCFEGDLLEIMWP